ncbi:MAG: GntR family transcriptional regulator [Victivallales bacterium]|nr:GntR family transcriptional regulator [Victivallales bacterium]
MSQVTGFKSSQVASELRGRIVSGEYSLGSRLPTCKALTSLYGVSLVTAYKALAQLESEGYITLKKHVGSTVSFIQDAPHPRCKSLNLITSQSDQPITQDFLNGGQRLFGTDGWEVKVFRVLEAERLPDDVLLAVNSPDAYSLFFNLHTIFKNTLASQEHFYERAIYLGEYLPDMRLTNITCDESATVHAVLEHFRARGRTRTAIFQYHLDNMTEAQRITAWCGEMMAHGASLQWCNDHLFLCDIQWGDQRTKWMRESFFQLLERNFFAEIDSLFVPIPKHAQVLTELCRKNGIAIPRDLAIVTLMGDDANLNQSSPALSYVDNAMRHHLKLAFQVLESRLQGQRTPQRLFTFHPELHVRESSL